MANAFFELPKAINEPVFSYAPGSPEKAALKTALQELKSQEIHIPMYIGGKKVTTEEQIRIHPPHDIQHTLGYYSKGSAAHVQHAIDAAMQAKPQWESMAWQDRAAIFLKRRIC